MDGPGRNRGSSSINGIPSESWPGEQEPLKGKASKGNDPLRRRVNQVPPDEEDLLFNDLASERTGSRLVDRTVFSFDDENFYDSQEYFDSEEHITANESHAAINSGQWESFEDSSFDGAFSSNNSGSRTLSNAWGDDVTDDGFESNGFIDNFEEDYGIAKLFGEEEYEPYDVKEYKPNMNVSPGVNRVAKILYDLEQGNVHEHEGSVTLYKHQIGDRLQRARALRVKVFKCRNTLKMYKRVYQGLSQKLLLLKESQNRNPEAEAFLEKKNKVAERYVSELEMVLEETVKTLDSELDELANQVAKVRHHPFRRHIHLLRQQIDEEKLEGVWGGKAEYKEALKEALSLDVERQKAEMISEQQRLDKDAQYYIDAQTGIIDLLNEEFAELIGSEKVYDAHIWVQHEIRVMDAESSRLELEYKRLEHMKSELQSLLNPPETMNKASGDPLSEFDPSMTPGERKEISDKLNKIEKDMSSIVNSVNEHYERRAGLSSTLALLSSLYFGDKKKKNGLKKLKKSTLEEFKKCIEWLKTSNESLALEIERRDTSTKNSFREMEEQITNAGSAYFRIDDPAFWNPHGTAVYSAESMPFVIKPGGTEMASEDYHDGLLFTPEEEGVFPEASPLLGEKEHLRDDDGNLAYALKLDKNGNPIPKVNKKGELESRVVAHEGWNADEEAVDGQVTIQPVYQQDLTRPLYGYDTNHNPAKINKKRLKEYKGAVRLAHAVKLFFKGTGTRLRDAFNFFKPRTPGAKAQRAVELMALEPGNIFSGQLDTPETFTLFRDIYLKKYKKDMVGLQRFHDLMGATLSSKLSFTYKEHQEGYENAMTTLVMVGAGLVDARDKEGDILAAEKYDQVLRVAEQREGRKRAGRIKFKHLVRAGKLMAIAIQEKEAIEKANAKALEEGRSEDVRDADEAAKQKLIETVMAKKGRRLPDDLLRKLDFMRDKTDELPPSDAMSDEHNAAIAFSQSQIVPSKKDIADLQSKINAIDDGSQSTALQDQLERNKQKQALMKELKVLQSQINRQRSIFKQTTRRIESILGRTHVLEQQTRDIIGKGILAHCGMLVSPDPVSVHEVGKYKVTKAKIQKHQMTAALKLAEDVEHYIASGRSSAAGVYKILTGKPPLSAMDGGRSEFTKYTPPHFLHATNLKSQLDAAFSGEDLVTHENRSGNRKMDLGSLRQDVSDILSTSGRLLNTGNDTVNEKLANILSMHVLVGAKCAKFADNKGSSSGIRNITKNQVLTAYQAGEVRRLAHTAVSVMSREDMTVKDLAKAIFPKSKKHRSLLVRELNNVWSG